MKLYQVCAALLLPAAFALFPSTVDCSVTDFPDSTYLQDDSLVWRASAPEYGKVYTSEDCGNASIAPLPPARPETETAKIYQKALPF